MKCSSDALDVKHVARAHESQDEPGHALLILRKLAEEDKEVGIKDVFENFYMCFKR